MAASRRERDRAWVAFLTNALLLPGAGSLMLGRRIGWAQLPLSLISVALVVSWLWVLVRRLVAGGLEALVPMPRPDLVGIGLGVGIVVWIWGLATTWDAVRGRWRAP